MKSFDRLVSCFKSLPGIGPKQAERLATHLIRVSRSEVEALSRSILEANKNVRPCRTCMNYTETEQCSICEDPGRDASLLCVVEQPADVKALERSGSFNGLYHVLHGHLSPLRGIGPEGIRIKELLGRLENGGKVSEVILATNPDTEGEATALYLSSILKGLATRVTRIGQGIPMGGHLDYMDEQTLSCALSSRREFGGVD